MVEWNFLNYCKMLKISTLEKKIGFFCLISCGVHSEWDFHKSGLCLLAVAGEECASLLMLLGAVPAWEGAEEL